MSTQGRRETKVWGGVRRRASGSLRKCQVAIFSDLVRGITFQSLCEPRLHATQAGIFMQRAIERRNIHLVLRLPGEASTRRLFIICSWENSVIQSSVGFAVPWMILPLRNSLIIPESAITKIPSLVRRHVFGVPNKPRRDRPKDHCKPAQPYIEVESFVDVFFFLIAFGVARCDNRARLS